VSVTSTDLVQETLSVLHAGNRDPINKLSATIDSSQTTLALTYELNAARQGVVIAIDLELIFVWEIVSEQSRTLTVERGYAGTTAAAHTAGALVTVAPKFPAFNVLNAINADLDDLSANGLFQVKTVAVTYSSAISGYDLPNATDIIEVLQLKYDEPGPARLWPEITSYKLRRASDTSDFSSGNAIVVYQQGNDGSPIRVTYAAPFTHFTALGQDIAATTGLPWTANDLPPMGAAYRLQVVREGQRNFNEAQPAPRRSSEVPPGAQIQAAQGVLAIRRNRIRVEASRLRKAWPTRKRLPA
jgi:hypothetical protein